MHTLGGFALGMILAIVLETWLQFSAKGSKQRHLRALAAVLQQTPEYIQGWQDAMRRVQVATRTSGPWPIVPKIISIEQSEPHRVSQSTISIGQLYQLGYRPVDRNADMIVCLGCRQHVDHCMCPPTTHPLGLVQLAELYNWKKAPERPTDHV